VLRSLLRATVLAGAVLVAAPPARAQQVDSTLVARYQLAESYLRAAQFDRAIGLLEDLVRRSPDTMLFVERLRAAYESVKRYDDAIALVDLRLDASASPPSLLADRARLLYLKGDEEAAFAAWQRAVDVRPEEPGAYLAVMRTLMQLRLFDRAVQFLELGRERTGDGALFQADLAYLYGLEGRHPESASEYVALLLQNPQQGPFVRGRLAQYAGDPAALDAGITVFERAVRERPLDRPVREILAWLYLEAGRYRDALNASRAIDRLDEEQGQFLFAFAQQASDAAAYDTALEAYAEILERYPDAPSAAEALAGMGAMYERRAERTLETAASDSARAAARTWFEAAVAAFGRFLEDHPGHPAQADIRYRRAHVLLDRFFDLDGARRVLEDLASRHPGSPAASRAAFDLGRIELLGGDLGIAQLRFSRLAENLRTGELAEAARYELALIHFYRAEFDAALALTESMKDNTAADVSNDAISLKILLIENRGPDSLDTPLRGYARVRLLERQRRPVEALALVDSLLDATGDHPLIDDIRFGRAGLLGQAGRAEEAAVAYAEIPLAHPDSPLADRSLFAAGDLYERVLGRSEAAVSAYTTLLESYPGSLLATEARARIRLIRGDGA
jgi:tetratricopeptide (TPR) repeat protein